MNAPGAASRAGRWLAVVASVVVLASIVAAIAVMGPPSRQRLLRMDERRIQDLGVLAGQVRAWHRQHGRLPASLGELAGEPGVHVPQDPATGAGYGYEALGEREFRLCADFATDTAQVARAVGPFGVPAGEWAHGGGRHCFKRRVD